MTRCRNCAGKFHRPVRNLGDDGRRVDECPYCGFVVRVLGHRAERRR